MNLADEYFKAYDAKEQLEKELENREKEIYSLKHDLIDARMEKDNLMKRIQELEGELQNEKKQLKQWEQNSHNQHSTRNKAAGNCTSRSRSYKERRMTGQPGRAGLFCERE